MKRHSLSSTQRNDTIITAESVTNRHPDKICDQIADAIVDACLAQDPFSRVAVEVIGGHSTIVLIGEITTKASVNYISVAKSVYRALVGQEIGVLSNIVCQSTDIAKGVDRGGAGDQGVMIGYSCQDNDAYIPQELFFCRQLLAPFTVDGKAQVTMKKNVVTHVVLSVQGERKDTLDRYVKKFFKKHSQKKFIAYCNHTGSFIVGGFDADSGATGRKIVVDAYGPRVPVGGGAFSGKDPTKVDRSGAYMARWIAMQEMRVYGAYEVLVKLAYIIGKVEPVMQSALIDGKEKKLSYDCRPVAIIERFNLRKPIYQETASKGHFGFKYHPWEKR